MPKQKILSINWKEECSTMRGQEFELYTDNEGISWWIRDD